VIDRRRRYTKLYLKLPDLERPPIKLTRGVPLTSQNTPDTLIRNRAAYTIRARKVKPSMPKLPWETET
jgi:hypothetical protein